MYHPDAFVLTKYDVVGAWIICLALMAAFLGYPAVAAGWGL